MTRRKDPFVRFERKCYFGVLIPAGTGLQRYNDVRVQPTEEAIQDASHNQFELGASPDMDYLSNL